MSFIIDPQENNRSAERIEELLRSLDSGERGNLDLSSLSDLGRAASYSVRRSWRRLSLESRRFLVQRMVEAAEKDIELDFARMLRIAVTDGDPEVRIRAIRGLWEDESLHLLDQLLSMVSTETDPGVIEAIAQALGRFAYQASVDGLDDDRARKIRETLLSLYYSDLDLSVRRGAIESLAYFSHDEQIDLAISDAYASRYQDMQVSSLTAMGHNLSSRWYATVLSELRSDEPEMVVAAARAAGEYGDERAVDILVGLVDDEDDEVRTVTIEALGRIGGRDAVGTLKQLARSEDESIREAAETAVSQAVSDADPMQMDS